MFGGALRAQHEMLSFVRKHTKLVPVPGKSLEKYQSLASLTEGHFMYG